MFRALSSDTDMENLNLDSTYIRVHESVSRGENQRIRQLDESEVG